MHRNTRRASRACFYVYSVPGIGVFRQGASLLCGMAVAAAMQSLALLPAADVAIKDFRLAYQVSAGQQPLHVWAHRATATLRNELAADNPGVLS